MKRLVLFCFVFSLLTHTYAFENKDLSSIHAYITQAWDTLRRSTFSCESYLDGLTGSNKRLYLPAGFPVSPTIQALKDKCQLEIVYLPKITKMGQANVQNLPMGLLYLPKAYVVPGGNFNEMYGWDSYFIMLGLIADNKVDYASDMLENMFFEIQYYGGILNANRSYYLTRSQPPFLTSMIRAVYDAKRNRDVKWLSNAYQFAKQDYHFWTSGSHLAGKTGLSRYYDFGHGPVPELAIPDNHYYADVQRQLKKPLNDHFYAGDRAMRESGFDTSFRFGPFSGDTTDYAPVDLNSLLYKAALDLAWMCEQLHHPEEAAQWRQKANAQRVRMNHFLWDAKRGMYFDYNFKQQQRSNYAYLSTFYPLWAQAASNQQANQVLKNIYLFEKKGGLVSSPYQTSTQWDAPYGWAPLQYLVVTGLHQYHYDIAAKRIANKFIHTVLKNFITTRVIHEKYDVIHESSVTDVKFGYAKNMVGFGWTNGVFLMLLQQN